ncbi:uncharacterized protein [Miscanthus floridulus]|uniref:uncharacterized protein n=1 Tax=Miscanthus floridulus TaxID=154761 RepID=UPI0034576DCC
MDLEKGIETEAATGASDAQIPVMARGEEKGLRISDLCVVPSVIDGAVRVVVAANMNPTGKKKCLRCWLMVTASVIFLTNHMIYTAPKYQMTPLELMVIFTVFMCAIFHVFRTMKQM